MCQARTIQLEIWSAARIPLSACSIASQCLLFHCHSFVTLDVFDRDRVVDGTRGHYLDRELGVI